MAGGWHGAGCGLFGGVGDDVRHKAARGSDLPHAKLTESKVAEIHRAVRQRQAYRAMANTLTNANLAKRYGVHVRTIEKVVARSSWFHVKGEL